MRRALALACLAAALLLGAAAPAEAAFGLHGLDLTARNADGTGATQAGSHPFALTTSFAVNTVENPLTGKQVPDQDFRDLRVATPPGLVADRDAAPPCSVAEFLAPAAPECLPASAVGTIEVEAAEKVVHALVYNVQPPRGSVARLGFSVLNVPFTVELGLRRSPPYDGLAQQSNVPQVIAFFGARLTLWGDPASPAHDEERGGVPAGVPERPFLTLPRSCGAPLSIAFEAQSWQGSSFAQTALAHGDGEEPLAMGGCEKLGFHPEISAQPTSRSAQSASGLDFDLTVKDEGLANPAGNAASDIERAEVTLPKGVTINPSQAEGLGACSEAQFAAEALESGPGQGCPQAAKVGTVAVESPLARGEVLQGALFVATPYENLASNSLIALYMTIRDPALGVLVKLAGKVEPGPGDGRLVATFGEAGQELPQLPFSHFHLHFREGGRSPLITPPACGPYTTEALLTPWAAPGSPYLATSTFTIDSGPGGGPCPSGSAPFHPGFEAGTANNAAGRYSPFEIRLTRQDGEQDMGRFSFVLPPGVVPKLAGIPYCPEAAIAQAKSRSGAHGGAEELAAPSCPAASQIGRTVAAAGVGSELTYVPGSLYLAGPYHGDPISAVAITPALAGPFDAGVVVVREALRLNPLTHVGEVDGAASDPIPHILKGIPLNVRDLRVFADRPEFTLNATSCAPSLAQATVWGDGTALEPAGASPAGLFARYQAAGCARLGFKPKLAIKLKGATKRGRFPALKAVVTPRSGDANFARAVVTLPHSAFLEQGHFGTICTRVQFAAGAGSGAACPPASIYGRARAWSPLLAQPLQGPVFLRSSNHNLPDLVIALHGLVDIDLAARIDSRKGGIRSSFEAVPDAPVSRFILEMRGGKKGLIVNSTNLCKGKHRARARLGGQNGRVQDRKPLVRALGCAKQEKKHKRSRHRRRA